MGFQDPDLKTPQHDALMTWLTDNVQNHPRVKQWAEKKWSKAALVVAIDATKKEWERPIKKAGYGVVGFIDLRVEVTLRQLIIETTPGCDRSSVVCVVDGKTVYRSDMPYFALNIEVKPSIRSVGDVIRQVNLYKQYSDTLHDESFFVASPDARFATIFEAQDIGFIQLPLLKSMGAKASQQLLEASE
jgi:hypothetical protein